MRIVVGTGNAGKLREFEAVLASEGAKVFGAPVPYAQAQPEETGDTFEANARIKLEALLACDIDHAAALTDDSGLMVDALGGAPGVRSARYAEGEQGLPQDAANRRKLVQAMRHVPEAERTARFVAVLALKLPDEPTVVFEGVCEGRIAMREAGDGGFGYDPLFIPAGFAQTFAELPAPVKHAHSHRGAALSRVMAHLRARGIL